MITLKKNSILSLLLILSFAMSSAATPGLRSIASVQPASVVLDAAAAPDLGQLETQVISELDRQADLVFQEFHAAHNDVPLSVLQHAQRQAVYRLKQMHVITDILKASGPSTATAIVATEILTNFVLAPIATLFGKPAVAGVMMAVPWGLVVGFGAFSYQALKLRVKLAHDLALKSLRPLDRIRYLVVGYDLKFRVSSIIYQSMQSDIGDVEFEILRKAVNFESVKVPGVTIDELTDLVDTTPDGKRYLNEIYVERLDPAFYSALLLRYVDSSGELTNQLMTLVKSRIPDDLPETDPRSLRRHLVAVSDVRAKLNRETKLTQSQKSHLKKAVKKGELSAADAKLMKAFLVSELVRLRDLRAELLKHEYSVLKDAQFATDAGQGVDAVRASEQHAVDLINIAAQSRQTTSPLSLQSVVTPTTLPLVCSDLFAAGF